MANPLMGMMGGGASAVGMNMQAVRQIKQIMGMLNSVKNPQQVLSQVAQQNPRLNAVMQMCKGRDPKSVFYEQCQKQGVNPDDVLKMLNG